MGHECPWVARHHARFCFRPTGPAHSMKAGKTWVLAMLALSAALGGGQGQEAPFSAAPLQIPAVPRRERVVSPRVAALLSAAMPKFEPSVAPVAQTESVQFGAREGAISGASVVRMPTYV